MTFFMIVDDEQIARFVHRCGVNRLFVDLEYMGKAERQKGTQSWKSMQEIEDVSRIREAVPDAHLLVRINPMHENSLEEINEVVVRGADSIMLPMFSTLDEVSRFYDMLPSRVEGLPLVETHDALTLVPEMCRQLPLERIHFGLNDLHLDLKNEFMFQPVADGVLEEAASELRKCGVRFGIGGIARAGEGILSPEYLLGEHVRLGSDAAILSRTFHRNSQDIKALMSQIDMPIELLKLQNIYREFCRSGTEVLEENRQYVVDRVYDVVNLIRKKHG